MLHKVKVMQGYKLGTIDGEIGNVKDFYFDDQHWTVRYMVVNTGNWLSGRQVLISPCSMVTVDEFEKTIVTQLNKKQIENSPPLDAHKPVSRKFETAYYGYYGWPAYWYGGHKLGASRQPLFSSDKKADSVQHEAGWEANMRSTQEVSGYHIQAKDGKIGHVEDFIIDSKTWAIRYMIVDTQNWWSGKKVLVAPQWIDEVNWGESKVIVDLSCETIKQGPEYKEESLVTREYETYLYQHYDREGYWDNESSNERTANTVV